MEKKMPEENDLEGLQDQGRKGKVVGDPRPSQTRTGAK
ncbi:hypothetical protein ACVJGD_001538 [Bradyrhizobium sp. USDA 10063]